MSPAEQTKALRDALNLVYYYNTNSQVKKAVDQAMLTRANAPSLNHPPMFYAGILMSFSRKFGDYFKKDLQGVRSFPEKIDNFFTYCYRNRTEYNKLQEIAHNERPQPTLNPPSQSLRRGFDISAALPLILLNTYSNGLSTAEKQQLKMLAGKIKQFENVLSIPQIRQRLVEEGHFSKKEVDLILKAGLARGLNPDKFKNQQDWEKAVTQTAAEIIISRRSKPIVKAVKKLYGLISQDREKKQAIEETENIINEARRPVQAPSRISTLASNTQRAVQKLADKYATRKRAASAAASTIVGLTGLGVAGPIGAAAGAATGLAIPSLITKGLGNIILQTGSSSLNSLGSLLSGFITIPLKFFLPFKWVVWGGIAILMFFSLGFSLPGFQGLPTAGRGGGNGSVDVNFCQLRRANQTPPDAPIKSTTLAGYFQEAERITTVPASVLAGITRLENASFVATAENDHDAFFGRNFTDLSTSCAPHFNNPKGMSSTGALGLMQIQPPPSLVPTARADAYERGGVNLGASFIGKTAETLTIADFCDPRKNIIIASGFILKKLQALGIGDGTRWDPAWTNKKEEVIDRVAKSFYGCLKYPDCEEADGTGGGPHNYGDDLWASIKSCKATSTINIDSIPKEKLDQIIYWGKTINDALEPGLPATKWNKMVQDITNGVYSAVKRTAQVIGVGSNGIYWCTNIVIDSYNLSNISGLNLSHQGVRGMLDFWKKNPDYVFVSYNGVESLKQVRPGYALFRLYPSSYELDHVSLIESISVDERGNGSIKTLDSNSRKSWSSTIEDGKIIDTWFLPDIVGFGGPK